LVGIPDNITGEALFGFVVLKNLQKINESELLAKLNLSLRKEIGPIIALKNILIISELPKTRSGKIVRRILRMLAQGEKFSGDASTLENIQIITEIEQKIV
jgi:acetate-coA ligase